MRTGDGGDDRHDAQAPRCAAREAVGVHLEPLVHLPHRGLGGAPVVRGAQVLEDGGLRLARLFLLDQLVHGVVHRAPLRPRAVVLRRAPCRPCARSPRPPPRAARSRRATRTTAPRGRAGGRSRRCAAISGTISSRSYTVARVAEVVADPAVELVVIGRAAHLALEVAEVLHEQVPRAVLADLQIVAARVDAAEDAREPRDEEIPLADVAPHLVPGEPARGEALEVLGAAERALREQLLGERVVPFLVGHRAPIILTPMHPMTLGRLRISAVVERAGPTRATWLLPDAVPDALERHREWLAPHFLDEKGRLLQSIHAFVIEAPGLAGDRGHVRRQRQGPRRPRALPHDVDDVPAGPHGRRLPAGVDRRRAVHAPARRPRGVEHAARERTLGADVPARAAPVHAHGVGALVQRRTTTTRSGSWATACGRCWTPGSPTSSPWITGSPARCGSSRRPDTRPGHVSLRLRAGDGDAVITGDLMHHPVQMAEPEWVTPFDSDTEQREEDAARVLSSATRTGR